MPAIIKVVDGRTIISVNGAQAAYLAAQAGIQKAVDDLGGTFKGDKGDTGPANNTYTSLAALKAQPVSNEASTLVLAGVRTDYNISPNDESANPLAIESTSTPGVWWVPARSLEALSRSGAATASELAQAITDKNAGHLNAEVDTVFDVTDEITLTADKTTLAGSAGGAINQITADKNGIFIRNRIGERVSNVVISGQSVSTVDASDPGAGLTNDWAAYKIYGGQFCRLIGNYVQTASVGISSQYGDNTLPERLGRYNINALNMVTNAQKMGIEHGGVQYEIDVANIVVGRRLDGAGSRANSHGRRLTGYSITDNPTDPFDAPAKGIVGVGCIVTGHQSGHNVQNTARYWSVAGEHYADCDYGFFGIVGTNRANDPKLGYTQFTSDDCDYGIQHGGVNRSVFDFTINEPNIKGIEETTLVGAVGGNMYRGIVNASPATSAQFRHRRNMFDMAAFNGSGTGFVISGEYSSGIIRAFDNANGIYLSAANVLLDVISAGNAGVNQHELMGSNNVERVQIGGKMLIGGNGNLVTGRADTVQVTGTDNDLSGMYGMKKAKSTTASTDASGELAVPLGLHVSATNITVVAGVRDPTKAGWRVSVLTVTGGTATFWVHDAAGVSVASTSVTIDWSATAVF